MRNRNRLIFWILFAAYTSIYVARLNLSTASTSLTDLGVLDTVQIGLLGSAFSTVFAIGRLLNGVLSDKTPPYRMLFIGLAVAGLSNIAIGFLPPYIGIFFLWSANAYAQSMLWSSILCVVTAVYGENAKKKVPIMVASTAVGNILGILLNTFFITQFGVSGAFWIPGGITLVLGIASGLCTKSIPAQAGNGGQHLSVWQLMKDRHLLKMAVPALFHGVMKENVSLWMTAFVVYTYQVDLSTSALYVWLIPLCGFVGRLLYSPLFRLCGNNENRVSLVGFLLCVAASLTLCFGGVPLAVAVLALGVVYAAVSLINTSILSIFPINRYSVTGNVASVSGVMDLATYMGSGLSSVLYGVIIQSVGYRPMFASWIVISVLSCVVLFTLKQNKPVTAE